MLINKQKKYRVRTILIITILIFVLDSCDSYISRDFPVQEYDLGSNVILRRDESNEVGDSRYSLLRKGISAGTIQIEDDYIEIWLGDFGLTIDGHNHLVEHLYEGAIRIPFTSSSDKFPYARLILTNPTTLELHQVSTKQGQFPIEDVELKGKAFHVFRSAPFAKGDGFVAFSEKGNPLFGYSDTKISGRIITYWDFTVFPTGDFESDIGNNDELLKVLERLVKESQEKGAEIITLKGTYKTSRGADLKNGRVTDSFTYTFPATMGGLEKFIKGFTPPKHGDEDAGK